MDWTSPTPITMRRRGRNHKNVALDPVTKKFIQLNDPPKPHKVELTLADKKRVIDEFKEVMGREPTEEEKEELFIEERKIKTGGD